MPDYTPVTLPPERREQLAAFLHQKLDWLEACHRDYHTNKIVKWRKMYDAIPAETVKTFPWERASNIVVPLIAIHTDTLHARIMAAVFRTNPLWVARATSEFAGVEDIRDATERFMGRVGIQPAELDLYRVYDRWIRGICNLGTSVIKSPWEKHIENIVQPSGMNPFGRYNRAETERFVRYEGPRPEVLRPEDFFIDPQAATEDTSEIIVHRRRMTKFDLLQRKFLGIYEAAPISEILTTPDRTNPSPDRMRREEDHGAKVAPGYDWAEWDLDECWLRYPFDGQFYSLIVTFHKRTRTILRAVYNFYPGNMIPFVAGHLIRREDGGFYAMGFAEALEQEQEEASTIHNQRNDNSTIANTRAWVIQKGTTNIGDQFRFYPGMAFPVDDVEKSIKPLQAGDVYPSSMDNERATISLAEQRSGVSPPMQGYGAGVMQGKRGVYTALGTMSMLQEGNRRTDANVADIRYAHTRLGQKLRAMYMEFGIGDRAKIFGERADFVTRAFDKQTADTIEIPVVSSSASINREVERQNVMALVNIASTFYQQMTQLIGTLANPQVPPPLQNYILQVANSATNLMSHLFSQFEYDDIRRYVPSIEAALGQSPSVPANAGGPAPAPVPGGPAALLGQQAQPPAQPFYQGYTGGTPGAGDMEGVGPNPKVPPGRTQ